MSLDPARYPVLARLHARLEALRRRRMRILAARAAVEALCVQLLLLPLAGLLAAYNPYDPLGLQLALATYGVYLWPLLRLEWARRRGAFAIQAVAEAGDLLNPAAPDIFRTVLSWRGHAPETLRALDAFYAPWEARLETPKPPILTRSGRVGLLLALGFAVAAPFLGPRPGAVFYRMVLPLRAWNAIPAPRLIPLDVPRQVLRGDSVTVRVRMEHVAASRAVYAHWVLPEGEIRYALNRMSGDTARFAFGPAARDFSLRFSTAGFVTSLYHVRVAERPRLNALEAIVTPPAYTGMPAERLPEMPALLSVLPGTAVSWKARAAMPLSRLTAEFRSPAGEFARIPVQGQGEEFSFRHAVRRAGELRLGLTDEQGAQGAEGPFRIELKIDAPPEITMLAPSGDQDLGRTLRLPVLFRAGDDYGIARVALRFIVNRAGSTASRTPGDPGRFDLTRGLNRREGAGGGVWDASGLRLEAGDAMEIWLEATDNDAVSGPKTVASAHVKLRVPSREEARAAVEAGERDASVSLNSALEREKRLRREEERPTKGAAADAQAQAIPTTVPEWEVQRVLSDQPRQHLQDLKRQLDAEVKLAEKNLQNLKAEPRAKPDSRAEAERSLKALRENRQEALAQEKRLPPPDIGRASPEQQKKSLESLNADQKALDKKLKQTPAPRSDSMASKTLRPESKALAENRKQLEEALKRNLQDQKDMKDWMDERERNAGTDKKRAEQAAQNAGQMEQDMKKALEQIDQAMEKGLENGTLSPEILEKMERIRELIEEVLDPDEKESLRQAQKNDQVDAGDLQRAMNDLLDKKDGLRQSLESAIKMLEALRETRALRDATAEVREISERQRELAAKMGEGTDKDGDKDGDKSGKAASAEELAESQQDLNKQMDAAMKGLENLAKSPAMKETLKDLDKQKQRDARANMQKAADKLKAPPPDRKAAKQGADLAAKQLKQMAAELEKKVAQMDQASNAAEIRATLEETLDFSGWLEAAADPVSGTEKAWGGEEPVRQAAVRVARWLRGRMDKLADDAPFESDVLRREAAAMGFEADALATNLPSSSDRLSGLRVHAQRAARELFKMLDKDQDGGGSQEGDGEGDTDAGGGESGNSGKEGMSGRMKGAAGKQGAVNRATQELLRSFLEGRESAPQGQGQGQGQPGQTPGGQRQGRSNPGSAREGSPREGQGEGQNEGESGTQSGSTGRSESGEGGNSGNDGGRSPNEVANAQQQVGESLEQLAESAGDAGGAARRLRQLAEEARELEEALRRRALSPDEIQRRQERFQTRLLEAANALEERGDQRERRAEAYKGGALPPSEAGGASSDESRIRELKRRRDEARKLPLPPEEKRRVEWYYERLLEP